MNSIVEFNGQRILLTTAETRSAVGDDVYKVDVVISISKEKGIIAVLKNKQGYTGKIGREPVS